MRDRVGTNARTRGERTDARGLFVTSNRVCVLVYYNSLTREEFVLFYFYFLDSRSR